MSTDRGYAVTLRGAPLARTMTHCPAGAMINGLALEFELWLRDGVTDEQIRELWLHCTAKLPQYGVAECEVRVVAPVDGATCDMRAGEAHGD